jgi:DNA invertase Pin-like site-specific DNA recombinase
VFRMVSAGVYKGRKPEIDPAQVRQLVAGGLGGTAIAKQLKISRASVYRLIGLGDSPAPPAA